MEKSEETLLMEEYKEMMNGSESIYKSPFIESKWEKINGIYKTFSLYKRTPFQMSTLSNGNTNFNK